LSFFSAIFQAGIQFKLIKLFIISNRRENMKKSYLLILFVLLLLPLSFSNAQLFIENFDYPVGDSIINHGWINHSGSGNQIVVVGGSLTYAGYPNSGIGNSVIVAGSSSSSEDVHANFNAQGVTGAVYAAFLANISAATTTGDYFFHLAPPFPTTYFKPRLMIKDDGSGNLQFGVTKALTGSAVYSTTTYSYNTTYLLVIKYEFSPGDSNDVAKLFINPTIASEPPVADLTSTDIVADDSIAAVCLRQGSQAYSVQVDGITIGTSWALTVPVEFTSFSAIADGDNAILSWTTATELNNLGFEIQRLQTSSDFVTVGFVSGHGTTTEPKNYKFTDANLSSGSYIYRLKQVDFDGTFAYSDEVNVEVTGPIQFELAQNYPNPFNPSTSIKFSIPQSSEVTLKVYNALGQEVSTLINQFMESGLHTINFDASSLNSGIYFYKLDAGQYSDVRKMTLIK
jgi:hypothetical protein